jgi:adenosine kinase
MSKIIVSGSIAYDRIMDFAGLFSEHLMPDKLHAINISFHVDNLSVQFGGCSGNIAYNLALLGEEPQIIASAGNDFGPYRAHLLKSGVDPSSIRIIEKELTSSAFILTDKADNQIAAFHGGAGDVPYDIPVELEGRALAIVAPGSANDMRDLPAHYRSHNFAYLYDPAQQIPSLSPEMLRDGISGAQVLFGSDYEYSLVRQKTGWDEKTLLEHVPTIAVTCGAKGSDIITAKGTAHVNAAPAQALVDPTGAGDAYRAGFIKGLMLGLPPETCAKIGSVAGTYAVESYGTQNHRYTKEEFATRFKKTYNETVSL